MSEIYDEIIKAASEDFGPIEILTTVIALGGLYFAEKQKQISQEQLRISQEQLRIVREEPRYFITQNYFDIRTINPIMREYDFPGIELSGRKEKPHLLGLQW